MGIADQGVGPTGCDRPSGIPDDAIGDVDLIRIRSDVSLRYDPATRQLVLHVDR